MEAKTDNVALLAQIIQPSGLIAEQFLGELKNSLNQETAKHPDHLDQSLVECPAVIKHWDEQFAAWIEQGRKKGAEQWEEGAKRVHGKESTQLEQANVRAGSKAVKPEKRKVTYSPYSRKDIQQMRKGKGKEN
ncbi:hypothetical protein JB92DRAFT_3115848 [Gautieria morchelliformis]|nr:hypothetical protein JB92DRAFT_3115848 [Gautieria morchelliformis]